MSTRVIIEADTPEELKSALNVLALGTSVDSPSTAMTPSSYGEFKGGRTKGQHVILETLEQGKGLASLRELEQKTGTSASKLSGALSSLNKESKKVWGVQILIPQRWFERSDGLWDRNYALNPDIYEPTATG